MDMEDTSKLKIFTGNAHPALAQEICDYIGVPLGKAVCGRFNNGEIPLSFHIMVMPVRIVRPAAENQSAPSW